MKVSKGSAVEKRLRTTDLNLFWLQRRCRSRWHQTRKVLFLCNASHKQQSCLCDDVSTVNYTRLTIGCFKSWSLGLHDASNVSKNNKLNWPETIHAKLFEKSSIISCLQIYTNSNNMFYKPPSFSLSCRVNVQTTVTSKIIIFQIHTTVLWFHKIVLKKIFNDDILQFHVQHNTIFNSRILGSVKTVHPQYAFVMSTSSPFH